MPVQHIFGMSYSELRLAHGPQAPSSGGNGRLSPSLDLNLYLPLPLSHMSLTSFSTSISTQIIQDNFPIFVK